MPSKLCTEQYCSRLLCPGRLTLFPSAQHCNQSWATQECLSLPEGRELSSNPRATMLSFSSSHSRQKAPGSGLLIHCTAHLRHRLWDKATAWRGDDKRLSKGSFYNKRESKRLSGIFASFSHGRGEPPNPKYGPVERVQDSLSGAWSEWSL